MTFTKKKRVVSVAGINGSDFATWDLIREVLTESAIWCTSEGSVAVDILVYETDRVRAAEILKADKRLTGRTIWFLPKPVLVRTRQA
jgi:hypothetical protein